MAGNTDKNKDMKKNETGKKSFFLFYSLPVIAWAVAVVTVSSIPGSSLPQGSMWEWDKLAHFLEYTIFAILIVRWFQAGKKRSSSCLFGLIAAGLVLFAILDEFHQMLIPFRDCNWRDMLADIFGVALGLLAGRIIFKKRKSQVLCDNSESA